ncbi:hypothetical protein CANMA_000190 [Candida margitis]|uniref:uncharacterized protein n=1 Tax=Candida margitis TaxID=1775924 RepID=UPI002226AC67|nr:uncharacterized protein CANMA_000190 [Candida margitis]KAI5970771.1 hypothetical protein CANMA_000190 [Candida margitis]
MVGRIERTGFDQESFGKELGIDGLTNDKLILMLEALVKNISHKITFQNCGDIIAQLDLDFSWSFELKKQEPEMSITFLCKLNCQQFVNNTYLQYEINQFKHVLDAKDSYVKFLELNFKQTHGEQLIRQYKKNNKEVLRFITTFDQKEWEQEVKAGFQKQRYQNQSLEDVIRRDIEKAVATTWPDFQASFQWYTHY